jgi:tRNA(fMet)-specific endonuclease VapC
MRYLLDTDTCIDLLRGTPPVVRQAATHSPDDCAVSSVTVYELLTGAWKCRSPETERRKVLTLLAALHQLPFDRPAAERAAETRAALEKAGTMIGPYDILLAGQAMAAGLILVTANEAEFARVPGLIITNWRTSRRQA